MPEQRAVVALTDSRWFDFLRDKAIDGRLDEVNFWRQRAQNEFRSLSSGDPFFFRMKHPTNAIVGYGFFATSSRLPIRFAWDAFEECNGDPSFERFVSRIAEYRHKQTAETAHSDITCIILREVHFLSEGQWIDWGQNQAWQRGIVAYKMYDLATGPGIVLRDLLRDDMPPELRTTGFDLVSEDERTWAESLTAI